MQSGGCCCCAFLLTNENYAFAVCLVGFKEKAYLMVKGNEMTANICRSGVLSNWGVGR